MCASSYLIACIAMSVWRLSKFTVLLQFRRIWPEMCAAKTDLLIVRPADWITL